MLRSILLVLSDYVYIVRSGVNTVPDPQAPQQSKRLEKDEWIALLVAFGTIGGIGAHVMLRDRMGGEFSLSGLRDEASQSIADVSEANEAETASPEVGAEVDRDVTGGDRDASDRTASQNMAALAAGVGAAVPSGLAVSESWESAATSRTYGRSATDPSDADRSPAATESSTRDATADRASDSTAAETGAESGSPDVTAGAASVSTDLEATSEPIAFTDVADDRWSKPFIDELSKRELVSGMPDTTFAPDRPVTRGELAAQIQKIFERDERLQDSITFTDVAGDYWGQAAIDKAVTIGFMSGYPNAVFAPDKSVSNLEVAVALATGLGLAPSDDPETVLAIFTDGQEIRDWARPKLAAATQAGFIVIDPEQSTLDPEAPATREVVAVMMYQALVWAQQAEPIESDRIARP